VCGLGRIRKLGVEEVYGAGAQWQCSISGETGGCGVKLRKIKGGEKIGGADGSAPAKKETGRVRKVQVARLSKREDTGEWRRKTRVMEFRGTADRTRTMATPVVWVAIISRASALHGSSNKIGEGQVPTSPGKSAKTANPQGEWYPRQYAYKQQGTRRGGCRDAGRRKTYDIME